MDFRGEAFRRDHGGWMQVDAGKSAWKDLRCGCGFGERLELEAMRPPDSSFLDIWDLYQLAAQWADESRSPSQAGQSFPAGFIIIGEELEAPLSSYE